MTTFHYRDRGSTPAPFIPAGLLIGKYQAELLILVDTGAECTLLEGTHLRFAGLDIFAGRPQAFQSFTGGRAVAYRHTCCLRLADHEIELEVAFSTQPLFREVLGRDALVHFQLWMRERIMELRLEPDLPD